MRRRLMGAAVLAAFGLMAQEVVLTNRHLKVTVEPKSGEISVLDRRNNYSWRQPALELLTQRKPVACPQLPGKEASFDILPTMLGDAKEVSGAADCSARFTLGWSEGVLRLRLTVRDQSFHPAKPGVEWWHDDSVEFWVNSGQYAIYPQPGQRTQVVDRNRKPLKLSAATTTRTSDGYTVDAELHLADFGVKAVRGGGFAFALGVNDADQPGRREGQIYYPKGWRHGQTGTYAPITLTGRDQLEVPQEQRTAQVAYTDVRQQGQAVTFTWRRYDQPTLKMRLELPGDEPELRVTTEAADPEAPLPHSVPDIVGFILDDEQAALAVADGTSGHLYPFGGKVFPGGIGTGGDLPFVALNDLKTGRGYGLMADTPDDGHIAFHSVPLKDGRVARVPRVSWLPSLGKFGKKARVHRYHFLTQGGYVAVAKVWRRWAKANGYLVTLKEKASHNPNVLRMMGASDVWGFNSLKAIREAKALGIEKLLINGGMPADQMREAISYGYLPGRYDIYTDVYDHTDDPEKIDAFHAPKPGHIVRKADGSMMVAWVTFDKKRTSHKRCTAVMREVADKCTRRDLAKTPYLARFLDVTTSEGLYECYHPDHPMTRSDKRHYSEEVCRLFGHWGKDDLNLVAGGEHGKWWGAKYLHYVEGMQSGGHGNYSWPAGYLKRPDNKFHNPWNDTPTNRFVERYEVYGLGPKYRVPLWDLALHDCISTTWYWGDATDFLMKAAPETVPRKDAFNILHASMPMFWLHQGTWTHDRSSFLRSYFHTTKVHELVGMEEMTNHQFLNEERTIHKTTFSDGTEIVVNMDDTLQNVSLKGKDYRLPPNGFAVDGPRLKQHLIYEGTKFLSEVRTDDFYFATKSDGLEPVMDGPSNLIAMLRAKRETAEALSVSLDGKESLPLPADFIRGWDWKATLIYRRDAQGTLQQVIKAEPKDGKLTLPAPGNYLLLTGAAAQHADLAVQRGSKSFRKVDARRHSLELKLTNHGLRTVAPVLRVYADTDLEAQQLLTLELAPLAGQTSRDETVTLDTSRLAGEHELVFTVGSREQNSGELNPSDNRLTCSLNQAYVAEMWPYRVVATLPKAKVDAELEPYDFPVDFAAQLKDGAKLEPSSVHVVDEATGQFLRFAQFHPTGATSGVVSVAVDTRAGRAPKLLVVARSEKMFQMGGVPFTPGQSKGSGTFDNGRYELAFREGTIQDMAPGRLQGGGPDFLSNLLVSSAATGWGTEEMAVVQAFDVLENGLAKTVVRSKVTLRNQATYTKRYTLTPGRIVIDIELDKPAGGNYSRGFYALPADYADSLGHAIRMDGRTGNGAGIAGQCPKAKWFALRGDGWAKTCVALTPNFDNISYWDGAAGSYGQLGFTGNALKGMRVAYFIHGKEKDFAFAERDYRQAMNPLK